MGISFRCPASIRYRVLEKARDCAERALVATYEPGAASGSALPTQSILAMTYAEVGDLEKAHSCATEAVKLSREHKTGGWEGLACYVLGSVLARMEEQGHEGAVECLERALMILILF